MVGSGSGKLKKHCAILGVRENFSLPELRDVYHRKASQLHPDLRPGDPLSAEAFKKVNVAYEHLKKHLRSTAKKKTPVEKQIVQAPSISETALRPPERDTLPGKPVISMDELVLRLRHSQNSYVRIHAVKAIEATGGKEAVWALLPSLDDPAEEVVLETVASFGNLRARIAAIPLIHLHKKSKLALRTRIEWALEQIRTPFAMKFLARIRIRPNKDASSDTPAANAYQSIALDLLQA